MSAGRAGSSLYNSNVNGNQGGGNKKGGLATTTNKRVQFVMSAIRTRAYSSPDQRKMIYCVNQLGGVGAPSKMFATTADGSCASCSKEAKAHNFVVFAYRQLLGRSVDESGLRKYTKQILNDPRDLAVGMSQVAFDLTNSPEGKKFARKIGSVEAQKRIADTNDFITSSTVVPDNFTPITEEEEGEGEGEEVGECEIDPASSSSVLKQKFNLMWDGCPNLTLTVNELKDYLLEGFTAWEEGQREGAEYRAANEEDFDLDEAYSKITLEKNNLDGDALELAYDGIAIFDTSGDEQIDSVEMQGHRNHVSYTGGAAAESCKAADTTTFLANIPVSFVDDSDDSDYGNLVNEEDWLAYTSGESKHPAFTAAMWNSDAFRLLKVDTESGTVFPTWKWDDAPENAKLMMQIESALKTIVPRWKMLTTNGITLDSAATISKLNEGNALTTVTLNISDGESFMFDTNRTQLEPLALARFYSGSDTYITIFDKNGQRIAGNDDGDDGDSYDSRIILNNQIAYEDNTAVFYALVTVLDIVRYSRYSLVDGENQGNATRSIKDFQNINCGVSWEHCARGSRVDRFQVNFTIINTEGGYPKTSYENQPSDRVTLADYKKWYKGNAISTQEGGTTYTAPSSYYTDYDDFSSSDCHKWYKITLNKID